MFSWDPKHGGVMVGASASELMKPSLVPQSNGIKDSKNFYSQNALPGTHNERYSVEKNWQIRMWCPSERHLTGRLLYLIDRS